MLYTIFWVILWLMMGGGSISIGTMQFYALIVAILADVVIFGYLQRGWVRRP